MPETTSVEDLGTAKKVVLDKENTTIVNGAGAKSTIEVVNRSEHKLKILHLTMTERNYKKSCKTVAELL